MRFCLFLFGISQKLFLYIQNVYILIILESVALFYGISNLLRLFYSKAILVEEQQWYYLTNSLGNKEVHTFSRGTSPKVNIILKIF